jgi:hypothetical protein
MKLMKLGARPDTFFTSGPVRLVATAADFLPFHIAGCSVRVL